MNKMVLLLVEAAGASAQPTGLLCDFQARTALGVRSRPAFTWIVPAAPGAADHKQLSYRIRVTAADGAAPMKVWDSGVVASAASVGVPYTGAALPPGKAFNWTVQTTTSSSRSARLSTADAPHTAPPSEPATFITALHAGFDASASYIWSPRGAKGIFAFVRKAVRRPASSVVRATAYISAATDDYML